MHRQYCIFLHRKMLTRLSSYCGLSIRGWIVDTWIEIRESGIVIAGDVEASQQRFGDRGATVMASTRIWERNFDGANTRFVPTLSVRY
jgi:hypothetical protein